MKKTVIVFPKRCELYLWDTAESEERKVIWSVEARAKDFAELVGLPDALGSVMPIRDRLLSFPPRFRHISLFAVYYAEEARLWVEMEACEKITTVRHRRVDVLRDIPPSDVVPAVCRSIDALLGDIGEAQKREGELAEDLFLPPGLVVKCCREREDGAVVERVVVAGETGKVSVNVVFAAKETLPSGATINAFVKHLSSLEEIAEDIPSVESISVHGYIYSWYSPHVHICVKTLQEEVIVHHDGFSISDSGFAQIFKDTTEKVRSMLARRGETGYGED